MLGIRVDKFGILEKVCVFNAVTFVTFGFVTWLSGHPPIPCSSVPHCRSSYTRDDPLVPSTVLTLSIFLAVEVGRFMVGRLEEPLLPWGIRRQTTPTAMMCGIYVVLISLHMLYLVELDFAHVLVVDPVPDGGARPAMEDVALRPVFTARYAEWCVNVPLLLVLLGQHVMKVGMNECVLVAVATVAYMLVAWQALITYWEKTRWFLIVMSFVGYGTSGYRMLQWTVAAPQSATARMPARGLRVFVVVSHVVAHGVYGAVYLLGVTNRVTAIQEHYSYMVLDTSVKAFTAVVISMIHTADSAHNARSFALKCAEANSLISSLLRASCTLVLPCSIDAAGTCKVVNIPRGKNNDLLEFEHLLGHPVKNDIFNEIVSGSSHRDEFREYVRKVWEYTHEVTASPADLGFSSILLGQPYALAEGVQKVPSAKILHSELLRKGGNLCSPLPVAILVSTAVQDVDADTRYFTAMLGLCIKDIEEDLEFEQFSRGHAHVSKLAHQLSLNKATLLGIEPSDGGLRYRGGHAQAEEKVAGQLEQLNALKFASDGFNRPSPETEYDVRFDDSVSGIAEGIS